MAQAQLRAGHNEQLRRLAQEIIVMQQQEIEVMRILSTHSAEPGAPAHDVVGVSGHGHVVNEATGAFPRNPVSHRDRVYAAEQFSNTVSVADPDDNSCSA